MQDTDTHGPGEHPAEREGTTASAPGGASVAAAPGAGAAAPQDSCYGTSGSGAPQTPGASGEAGTPDAADEPRAECVLCRAPTEYPETRPGIVLCPVCEWQEAQRSACSG